MREILLERGWILTFACLLDLLFGDPHWLYHPVQAIGFLISRWEGLLWRLFRLREPQEADKGRKRLAGVFLVLLVLLCTLSVVVFSLWLLERFLGSRAALALQIFWCAQLLAAHALFAESQKVYRALKTDGLAAGRRAVSMIVGRDTAALDETAVVKAAVETIAENTSDGIIAPMLFFLCFGLPGMFFYKAVNTMDSMVGYRNARYYDFGTAAARLDDLCNLLPSRLSGILMVLSAEICSVVYRLAGKCLRQKKRTAADAEVTADTVDAVVRPVPPFSFGNAWRIFLRDRRKHKSPNSAQTEAACAGALSVQLAGPAYYFGKRVEKPYIGDPIRPVEKEDIIRANLLMLCTAGMCYVLGVSVLASVVLLG